LLTPAGLFPGIGIASRDILRQSRPTIIYAARTHTQVSQVIHELQQAAGYRPKIAVLASRDRLCVHNGVNELKGRKLQRACLAMQTEGKTSSAMSYAADSSSFRRLKYSRCPAARQLASFLEMYSSTSKVFQIQRAVSVGKKG